MKTKEEFLIKNGIDWELFEIENEFSSKAITTSLQEYADQQINEFKEKLYGYINSKKDYLISDGMRSFDKGQLFVLIEIKSLIDKIEL